MEWGWTYLKEWSPNEEGRYLVVVEYSYKKSEKRKTIEIAEYHEVSSTDDKPHFIFAEGGREWKIYVAGDGDINNPYRITWWRPLPEMPVDLLDDEDNENASDVDENEYPTNFALNAIQRWPIRTNDDFVSLMNYIQQIWYCPHRMTHEGLHYTLVTSGWSGNEDIIAAMQSNIMLHMLYWYESRRGGHHEYKPINDRGEE